MCVTLLTYWRKDISPNHKTAQIFNGVSRKTNNDTIQWCKKEVNKIKIQWVLQSLYCCCRQPENDKRVVECKRCHEWYHDMCVPIPKIVFTNRTVEWFCPCCRIMKLHILTQSLSTYKLSICCNCFHIVCLYSIAWRLQFVNLSEHVYSFIPPSLLQASVKYPPPPPVS